LLYRIARNLVVDYHRKEGPKKARTVTFDTSETSTLSEGELTDRSRGQSLIEARADMALVLGRISRLKEDYHDVLILRLIDGLSFADIAQVLDKTPGNVRVIYHRAMKALDQLIITKP
jgi:RNA polymerase sigma-70 factor (ECF subfamily)